MILIDFFCKYYWVGMLESIGILPRYPCSHSAFQRNATYCFLTTKAKKYEAFEGENSVSAIVGQFCESHAVVEFVLNSTTVLLARAVLYRLTASLAHIVRTGSGHKVCTV